ncbi:MAG: glycosyltransferase [Clostridia bacterium]|nr:glycosyltransferase [Clostridia bacterium]
MDKLVSIIIPVYNLENYIENCLNSLVNQTYRNLEILCIDDGSKDRSGEIISAMAEKDSRIVYIRQENAGVSAARNNGLDHAKGEYIMFVDGDDYMHFQAVELLYKTIEEKQCNTVFGRGILTSKLNDKMKPIENAVVTELSENILFEDGMDRAVWGKIFRREVLEKFRFPVGITNAEDFNYMLRVLHSIRNNLGYRLESRIYYYYMREDSASFHEFSPKNITEIHVNEMNAEYFADKEDCYLKNYSLTCLFKALLFVRTKSICSPYEQDTKKAARSAWRRWRKTFLKANGISIKDKLMITACYYSRHLYELARQIQDPTMKDFYKNRKNKRS